jgi:hypothetical protein
MPSLSSFSRLLSGPSSDPSPTYNASPSSQTLTLHRSLKDSNTTLIHRAGDPIPLYIVTTDMASKPQIQISRLFANGTRKIPIGAATFPSLSTSVNISLGNFSFDLKQNQLIGDSCSFTCPPLPKMKWRAGLLGGSMELSDTSRTRLARYKAGLPVVGGGKKLEVLLPCDDFILDLIVVSGMTAAHMNKMTEKAVSEVAQALAGV